MSAGWNTIESDAGVFTYLVETLGVKEVQFEELLSLDSDSLKQLSPVYGVIFLFKYPTDSASLPTTSTPHHQPPDGTFDPAASSTLFFASQVIPNACGTQALLSVLLNKDASATAPSEPSISIGPHLTDFKSFTAAFPPALKGEALSNSEPIRAAHNAFARAAPFVDESARPSTSADDDSDAAYHFIAYVAVAGTLYELDGLQPAPISHGACGPDEFADRVVPVLRRRVARYPGEIRFALLAVVRDLRVRAREAGDGEGLEREVRRRREWVWEDALRRHNLLGFAAEVLKAVVRGKVADGEGGFERWIEGGKEVTRRRVEEGRRKKGGGEVE